MRAVTCLCHELPPGAGEALALAPRRRSRRCWRRASAAESMRVGARHGRAGDGGRLLRHSELGRERERRAMLPTTGEESTSSARAGTLQEPGREGERERVSSPKRRSRADLSGRLSGDFPSSFSSQRVCISLRTNDKHKSADAREPLLRQRGSRGRPVRYRALPAIR